MHTPLCRHATGEPAEYAAQAVHLGLTEIGFSDHAPMPRDDFDDWRMRLSQLDEYVANVRKTQRDFPGLRIKLALEVDYLPGTEDWMRQLAAKHPWDYLIGSVHYVSDSWDIDNPSKRGEWQKRDAYEVWSIYFDRLSGAAESGLFDIIGHVDLPKKFCCYPDRDYSHLVRQFLAAAAQTDAAIELNTAGLRKDCREIYPSRHILELAYQQGVKVTFGSDAHAPEEVGLGFPEAIDLARSVGYTSTCRFTGRHCEPATL